MSVGSFGILESNITGRGEKKTQTTCLATTTSGDGEVAQRLMSATRKWRLGRQVRIASSVLRVRTSLIALRII